jgi:hypothetical protein
LVDLVNVHHHQKQKKCYFQHLLSHKYTPTPKNDSKLTDNKELVDMNFQCKFGKKILISSQNISNFYLPFSKTFNIF